MDAHKNFAYSLVATAPSPANSGTSLVVTAGTGTKFPAVPFNAVVWQTGVLATTANSEIVRVTAISTDTLTIVRNTNTEPNNQVRSIVIGDQIAATVTAKTLTDIETPWSHDFPAFDDVIASYSVNHGLGRAPVWVRVVMVCDTNDTYDAGDEIELCSFWDADWGPAFVVRSTAVKIDIVLYQPIPVDRASFNYFRTLNPVGTPSDPNMFVGLDDASRYHLKVYAF